MQVKPRNRTARIAAPDPAEAAPHAARLQPSNGNPHGVTGPALFEAYRAAIAPIYDVHLPDPAAAQGFHAGELRYHTRTASLARSSAAAQILTRTPRHVAGGTDEVMLYRQEAGTLEGEADGRPFRLEPGDLALFDYARPLVSRTTDFTNLVLTAARGSVPAALLGPDLHGHVIPGGGGPGRLLGTALTGLFEAAGHLRLGEAEAAFAGVLGLAAGLVEAARLADADTAGASEQARHAAVMAYIDAHHGSPDLDADAVAAHLGLSRATLYRLFKAEGGIQAALLRRRLDHVAGALIADPRARQDLAGLAGRHGFGGLTQLGRSFKARYGMPPSQYAAFAARQDAAWHTAQIARLGLAHPIVTEASGPAAEGPGTS